MKSGSVPIPHVRFGPFEVDFETGEMCKHGLKLRLQEKPLRVLQALVEKPGKLVTREDLRNKLWPEDHYVDFDRNLTIAMNRLRTVLSDSADEPRYIETLPRRGYRFIYPVDGEGPPGSTRTQGGLPHLNGGATLGLLPPTQSAVGEEVRAPARLRSRVWLAGPLALAVVLGAVAWYRFGRLENAHKAAFRIVPVTSSPGGKGQPVFSPDGKELAYSWRGEKNQAANIYVSLIGAGPPLRLTADSSDDCSPAWSPDGRSIAFLRDGAYYLVSALGGAERKLADAYWARCGGIMFGRLLDWSPDGKFLAVADRLSPQDPHFSLLLISIENGQRTAVVSQAAAFVDCPAFSPDGRTIAFAAGAGPWGQEIWVVPAIGGEARQLTFDKSAIGGLSWTADGSEIVFSSDRSGGLQGLWRIGSSGGTPEPVSTVGADSYIEPSIALNGNRLAYLRFKMNLNIWRTAGPNSTEPSGVQTPVIVTTGANDDVSIAPDGKKIAFESDRTGVDEIWTSNSDGTGQIQLTSIGHGAGTPRWSPDGNMIAFDCQLEGHGDIFVISANGGSPRRVTNEPFQNVVPSWSRDSKWVYFSSDRTGTFQVWKVAESGGTAVQLTRGGGFYPRESPEGKDLFYWKDWSVWKMPVAGGEETRVVRVGPCQGCWKVIAGGVCFVDSCATPYRLKFLDFKTSRVKDISRLHLGEQYPLLPQWGAFDVSPDGRWILYGYRQLAESDIMLLEGFH